MRYDQVKNPAASGGASSKEKAPEGCYPQIPAYYSSPPQAVGFSGFFHVKEWEGEVSVGLLDKQARLLTWTLLDQ